MKKYPFYLRFMDQAGEGGDGSGGGAAAPGAGAAPAAATPDAGAASDDKSTTLQQGAQPPTPAIPEKYQVKKADGTLDIEASSLKLAEGYSHLEKRAGAGELPPKTADEYQITVPDALKETWKPDEDPMLQEFRKDAHAAGLNQKQFDFVMEKYFKIAPELVAGARQLSADECVADLKKDWKTDEQYKAEIGKAYKAAVAYGDKDAEAIIKDYGNDPRIVRMLSRIGKELGEDKSIHTDINQNGGATIESLLVTEAYTNPKHPDHARVSKQVADHFAAVAKAAEKAGGQTLM